MTPEELNYIKQYVKQTVLECLNTKSDDEQRKLRTTTFADRHMQVITGQQYLPQGVFRSFLDEIEFKSDKETIEERLEQFREQFLTYLDIKNKDFVDKLMEYISSQMQDYVVLTTNDWNAIFGDELEMYDMEAETMDKILAGLPVPDEADDANAMTEQTYAMIMRGEDVPDEDETGDERVITEEEFNEILNEL